MIKIKSDFLKENIESLEPFSLRLEVQKALKNNRLNGLQEGRFVSRKTKNPLSSTYTKAFDTNNEEGGNMIDKVRKFNKTYDDNMAVYKDLKEDNEHFANEYNKRKVAPSTSNNKISDKKAFADLVAKYRDKGYKIPDLSVNKNLFKPSFLLMENFKISNYFKYVRYMEHEKKDQKDKKSSQKDTFFIHNLDYNVNFSSSTDEMEKKKMLENKKVMKKNLMIDNKTITIKTPNELRDENKKLRNDIHKIKKLLEDKERKKEKKRQPRKSKTGVNTVDIRKMGEDSTDLSKLKFNTSLKNINFQNSPGHNKIKTCSTFNFTQGSTFNVQNHTATTGFETLYSKRSNFNQTQISSFRKPAKDEIQYYKERDADDQEDLQELKERDEETISSKNENENLTKNKSNYKTSSTYRNIKKSETKFNDYLKKFNSPIQETGQAALEQKGSDVSANLRSKFKTVRTNRSINSMKSVKIVLDDIPKSPLYPLSPLNEDDKTIKRGTKTEVLNDLYGKINKDHHNVHEEIKKYFGEFKKKEYNVLVDTDNLSPNDLLKYINDLKNKISASDFNEVYRNFMLKYGGLKLDFNELKHIKKLDERIFNMDKVLVKELRKIVKD